MAPHPLPSDPRCDDAVDRRRRAFGLVLVAVTGAAWWWWSFLR